MDNHTVKFIIKSLNSTEVSYLTSPNNNEYYPFKSYRFDGLSFEVTFDDGRTENISYVGYDEGNSLTEVGIYWNTEDTETGKKITFYTDTNSNVHTEEFVLKSIKEHPSCTAFDKDGLNTITLSKNNEYVACEFVPEETKEYTLLFTGKAYSRLNIYEEETQLDYYYNRGTSARNIGELTAGKTYYFVFYREYGDCTFAVSLSENIEHTHTFSEWVQTVSPTCKDSGKESRTCSICGTEEVNEVQALGHQLPDTYELLVNATCTEDGTQYKRCERCLEIVEYSTIPKLGHNFSETFTVDKEASETESGSMSRHCDRCTATTDVTAIPMTGSIYETVENLTDIEADTLTDTDKELVKETVNQLLEETKDGTAETMMENVSEDTILHLDQLYVASNNNIEATEVSSDLTGIKVEGGAITAGKYLPETLEEGASYKSLISISNVTEINGEECESLAEKVKDGTAYVWDINLSVVDSNGTAVTGAEDIQPVAPIRMTIAVPEEWKDKDFKLYHYNEDGTASEIAYELTEGNVVFTILELSYYALEEDVCSHPMWQLVKGEGKESTCKEPGYEKYKCKSCGATKIEAVSLKDHNWSTVTVEATCTTDGYVKRICSLCSGEKVISTTSATGHEYGDWVRTTEPTTEKTGVDTRTCYCGATETRNVDKLPAEEKPSEPTTPSEPDEPAIPSEPDDSTADEPGTSVDQEEPEHTHVYGEWKVTKQATALQAGEEVRTCQCGVSETREMAKLKATIKLSATKLPLQVKKSTTVLKVTKMTAGDKVKSWKSSKPKVVSVNKKGKLTAKKTGKAVITVTLASGKKAKCTITVQKGKVATKSIKLSKTKLTVKKGKKATLSVVQNPLTSQDKVTFTSSNKKIATVNSKGVIVGKKKGKVKITVKSGKKKAVCTVTVK